MSKGNKSLKRTFPAFVLAGGLALTGCTGGDEDELADVDSDELFTEYTENVDAYAEVNSGLDQLTNVCLAELGVHEEYLPEVIPVYEEGDPDDYLMVLRERVSVAEAEEHGYAEWDPSLFGTDPSVPAETDDEFVEDYAAQLVYSVKHNGENATAFLTGAEFTEDAIEEAGFDRGDLDQLLDQHPEGCIGAVNALVFGDDHEHWEELTSATVTGINPEDHDEFNALQSEWSACMASNGHEEVTDYYSIHQIHTDHMLNDMTSEEFDEVQREVALSDAECSEELNINEKHQEFAKEILRDGASGNEAEFFAFQEEAEPFIERIHELIEEDAVVD